MGPLNGIMFWLVFLCVFFCFYQCSSCRQFSRNERVVGIGIISVQNASVQCLFSHKHLCVWGGGGVFLVGIGIISVQNASVQCLFFCTRIFLGVFRHCIRYAPYMCWCYI